MAEVALREKGQVEGDGGDGAAGDEEGFEFSGADVADVGDGLAGGHGWVEGAVGVDDPVQEEAEEEAEPDCTGEDGEPLVTLVGLPID